MGVHGLWKLIEPSGKAVPLDTLENKVLAVDVSIWLHQAVKGFQDSKGASIPNAHLLGIYHRVCKLLYFKIKPIFVFDGGVPALKKETIAKRNQSKNKNLNEANRIQKQILNTLLKHTAVNKVLSERTKANLPVSPKKNASNDSADLFVLPPSQLDSTISSSDEEEGSSFTTSDSSPTKYFDIHTIDEKSAHFKSLPADVRHEILSDLKETRKQSSWGRIHELPTQSDDFSGYQMKRLLKRSSIQASLEEAEKEMGGHSLSLGELEALLNDHGVLTDEVGKRIASDENTRYLYIKDVKKALEKVQLGTTNLETISEDTELKVDSTVIKDDEYEKNLERAIELSLQETPSTSYEVEASTSTDVAASSSIDNVASSSSSNDAVASSSKDYVVSSSNAVDSSTEIDSTAKKEDNSTINDKEFQRDLEAAIKQSLEDISSKSNVMNSFILDDTDSSEDDIPTPSQVNKIFSAAKSYMMEYSGLTPKGIEDILNSKSSELIKKSHENKKPKEIDNSDMKLLKETNEEIIDISSDITKNSKSGQENSNNEIIEPDNESVGVISDSESDSNEEFVEVSTTNSEKKLEIVINAEDEIEDDIFSDIFGVSIIEKSSTNEIEMNKLQPEQNNTDMKDSENNEVSNEINICNEISNGSKVSDNISSSVNEDNTLLNEVVAVIGQDKDKDHSKTLSKEQLKQIETNLENEKNLLVAERSTKERLANNITDQMYQETQELLQLFGIPYIIAPMEAEAQCAFLNEIDLTDGTITDDSDIWLFGGKTVYKNFFNQNKHVMEYRSENIENHFRLSRLQLILLALLVGSDYTTGIPGVGPVTALEILANFPPKIMEEMRSTLSYEHVISGMIEFRSWFHKGKAPSAGRAVLRNKLKNVTFTDNFPSLNVIRAYLEPAVETSKDNFSWGKPDIVCLTDYAKLKFGWSLKKSEEILQPVINRLKDSKSQSKIKDYFRTKHKLNVEDVSDKMSKRVKKAVTKLSNQDEPEEEIVKEKVAKKSRAKKSKVNSTDEDIQILKQTQIASKKRVKEIEKDIKKECEKRVRPNLHKKDVIPQKERDKSYTIRSKLKAIEVFRKSKQGPGFAKKRQKIVRKPKSDAELSESSSDS